MQTTQSMGRTDRFTNVLFIRWSNQTIFVAFHPSFNDCIILLAGQLLELSDFGIVVFKCILFLMRAEAAYLNLMQKVC